MKAIQVLLLGILSSFPGSTWSQNNELTLRQLNHRLFTATNGAPRDINGLAQTPDGTLWIGGRTGLTRFDGVRFVPYPGSSEEPLQSTNISSLFVAPDGGLWIGFRPGGVSLLKGGRVTNYGERDGLPNGTVGQFAWDRDGSVWAATRTGLAHLKDKRWEKVTDEPKLATPYGVLVDRAGTLWVASVAGLFARVAGESRFREIDDRVYDSPWALLAAAPDGKIWAAARHELIRVDRPSNPERGDVVVVRGVSGGPLLVDGSGNLWGSELNPDSLLRVPNRDLVSGRQREVIVQPEKFSAGDGLQSGRVFALLEDRERNVWVGTNDGLHRFSVGTVVRDTGPVCSQDQLIGAAFAAGDAGDLWIACNDGSKAYVVQNRDGAVVTRHATPILSAAHRDRQGIVWFGGPTALGRVENGRITITPLPAHVSGRPAQALLRDASGAIWVSFSRTSTFRLLDGEWSQYGNLDDLPRGTAYVMTADAKGILWFGYTNNLIARVNGRHVQRFEATHGLRVGNVMAILAHDGHIWVGGELGLARFDGSRFVMIRSASGDPFRGISGIASAGDGELWLNGTAGIVRIARQEIEHVLRDPAHPVACEVFDYLDGVPGTAIQLRPLPSAIAASDGRIWFSTTAGIVSIDTTRMRRNTLPPPVTIWSLTSGSTRYPIRDAELPLPVDTTDLQIEYSAGSLTVPERVRFRYRLEGSDRDWQDVGTRREAVYTNLGPGRYGFRVIASNNDGVWNKTGAIIHFTIPPAFYQTRWFYAVCSLGCLGLLIAVYRMRMQQVAAQVRGRLEARLAERERIARDLHDTLLQGMQGLIWRFQAATDHIQADERARHLMEESLDRADKLLAEGRDKVKDLRPATDIVADLAQALSAEGEQFAQLHPVQFSVTVQGSVRELHPIVREEGFLIGREALTNAFRHSRAACIEVEVIYGVSVLHVRVRDDGQGIHTAVLDAGGSPGHFGLVGMRERAKKLGAHLEVWSKPGSGTELDFRVPADVAYRRPRTAARGFRSWLAIFHSPDRGN